jgi:parvulin-like peptidyl-prolyl isomerase
VRQFHQAPDASDLRGLVEQHIREEVLCREALALGLDRDDSIVSRRLAQKMEFLTQDITMAASPADSALEAFFIQNAARYSKPSRVSFRHLFFSRGKRGIEAEADAKAALEELAKPGASEEAFGDAFLHGFEFSDHREQDLADLFGPEFAATAWKAPLDAWSGPIPSSYGVHLVRLTHRLEPQPASLADVREAVLRDWMDERRRALNEETLARMKQDYQVIIDEAALETASTPPAQTLGVNP